MLVEEAAAIRRRASAFARRDLVPRPLRSVSAETARSTSAAAPSAPRDGLTVAVLITREALARRPPVPSCHRSAAAESFARQACGSVLGWRSVLAHRRSLLGSEPCLRSEHGSLRSRRIGVEIVPGSRVGGSAKPRTSSVARCEPWPSLGSSISPAFSAPAPGGAHACAMLLIGPQGAGFSYLEPLRPSSCSKSRFESHRVARPPFRLTQGFGAVDRVLGELGRPITSHNLT